MTPWAVKPDVTDHVPGAAHKNAHDTHADTFYYFIFAEFSPGIRAGKVRRLPFGISIHWLVQA